MSAFRRQSNVRYRPIADTPHRSQTELMRTPVPAAFSLSFTGPEGPYAIRFEPTDEWDGVIEVSIGGVAMRWPVAVATQEVSGAVVLSGMTSGSEPLWSDQYWFELRVSDVPPLIRYWGNQIIWREDRAA